MSTTIRLTKIGQIELPDHHYLAASDHCFFLGEYTPFEYTDGKKWGYSPMNQLITNLKKSVDKRGRPEWLHKEEAIERAAKAFAMAWKWEELDAYNPLLVPMPPSKPRTDPLYDERMLQILYKLANFTGRQLDIRDCLSFSGGLPASHATDQRPSPDLLYANLYLDYSVIDSDKIPGVIFLFDDMLTTGAHFVAARRKLQDIFPSVDIVGVFVSRRRLPNSFQEAP